MEYPSTIRIGRRVVTGFDDEGKSIIWIDGDFPKSAKVEPKGYGHVTRGVWASGKVPVTVEKNHDPMESWLLENPFYPEQGVIAGLWIMHPGYGYPMHATDTVDIMFILSGQLELTVEKGSTVLRPGDCVVQRGTAHSWRVVGDQPCISAGVLLAKKKAGT